MIENVNDKNRKLIKALELIGDYELMKPIDKIDGDLIEATVGWSLRLQNKDITLSTEEIEKMVSMIPFDEKEELHETNGEVPNQIKVLKKNKILFIAAIIAILVTLLTIVSVAFEWNIFEELKNRFGTVADTPVNEEIVVNGVTVVRNDEYRKYSSVEEALKSENIDVLYPSYLPDGTIIEKVSLYQQINNKLLFVFNDKSILVQIIFNGNIDDITETLPVKKFIKNEKVYYICEMIEENRTQIYFEYNNNVYILGYTDEQELINIIENLKELE